MKRISLILFFIFCKTPILWGQSTGYYPSYYTLYNQSINLLNPGLIDDTVKIAGDLYHKTYTGNLTDINATYFTVYKTILTSSSLHQIKCNVQNEQEGPFINTPKFSLNYSYSQKIAENSSIYSGINLGVNGIYLSSPSVNNTFYLPDGALGFGIKHRNSNMGISSYQIFNNHENSFLLRRYYQYNFSQKISLHPRLDLHLYSSGRIFIGTKNEYYVNALSTYNKMLDLGISFKRDLSISYIFGLLLPIAEDVHKLKICVAYNTNNFSSYKNLPNSIELGLSYKIFLQK